MVRSKVVVSGFDAHRLPVASRRLIGAVAASLALALCICAGLTLMTITDCAALPLWH